MPRFSKLAPALMACALLASGCGAHGVVGSPTLAAKGKVAAKDLSMRDVGAMVGAAVREHSAPLAFGIPAILKAPSDVAAQRGLTNEYLAMEAAVMPEIDPMADEALNKSTIPQFLATTPEVTKPEITQYLQGIADRLTTAAKVPSFKVYVADTQAINAFNAGGHALVVFTGLVMASKDESELAGVFAHEMTHGLKRHAVKGMAIDDAGAVTTGAAAKAHPIPAGDIQLAYQFISTLTPAQQDDQDYVLSYLQGKVSPEALTFLQFAFNEQFASIGLTRAMEAEADQGGVRMLAGAGYAPNGMVSFFERLNTRPDGDTRYYSHPALGSRAGSLKAQIAREGLKGTDTGADRLAAIQALIMPPAPAGATALQLPHEVAGAGCFAGLPVRPIKLPTAQ